MARHYYIMALLAAASLSAAASAQAQDFSPVAPGGLKADVKGTVVNLSWEWGNAGESICTGSFEEDAFSAPWSVKNTYDFAPESGANWMIYDFSDYPDDPLNHDGTHSALLMMASEGDENDPTTLHQDEWLMVRPGTGAVYMDFWYFLHPELREVGGYKDFPDHYYVLISRDNGETWNELWDGRWDMGPGEGVQQASLFLGNPTDENTLVAFNAVSADEESLYFLWTVDDVNFYTESQAAERSVRMSAPQHARSLNIDSNIPLYRKFVPADVAAGKVRRAPESEWLNGGNITYRVYLDGDMIADYLKARYYTDYSDKTPGEHVYSVMAWSEAKDLEYDKASVTADVAEQVFAPARNIKASYNLQSNGKYTIEATWEHPEDDMVPDHYDVFVNGKSIGYIGKDDQLEIGQSGLYKGAYTFEVIACYTFPDGESDPVYASVFPGTVPTPGNLRVVRSGNDTELTWKAPEDPENAPTGYQVYRGTELLGSVTELSYTDRNVPAGTYNYSVHAVYSDGSVSLPETRSFTFGDVQPMDIPYSEDFASAHIPAGWSVELIDSYGSVKEMYSWRFDNWFDIEVPESAGLKDYFASVSGVAAAMNRLETHVVSPLLRIPDESNASVSFDKYYFEEKPGPSGSASFLLQVSTDNGMNWADIKDLAGEPNGKCAVDLSDYCGQTIQLRWAFLSRNSGVAAFDNVQVSNASGVTDILSGMTDSVEVYTIAGVAVVRGTTPAAVKSLPAGVYILRSGSKSTKILIR